MTAAGLLAVAVLAGCRGSDTNTRIEVWSGRDPYEFVVGLAPEEAEAAGTIHLAGAVNETVGFCLALSSTARVRSVNVAVKDLVATSDRLPSAVFSFYRVATAQAGRAPGWHVRQVAPHERVKQIPDVLIPAGARKGGLPCDLTPGDPVLIWVDVQIPKGTTPDTYLGRLTVSAGEVPIRSLNISLTAWPFVLPDIAEIAFLADLDHQALFAHHVFDGQRPVSPPRQWDVTPQGSALDAVLRKTMLLLQEHGVTPLLPDFVPIAKVDADERVAIDWSDYDRVVAPYLSGELFADRRPLPVWRVPFHASYPPPPESGDRSNAAYQRMVELFLSACADHFSERGWLERSFVELPGAVPGRRRSYETARLLGERVKAADSDLRTLTGLVPQDLAPYGWTGFESTAIGGVIDIWAPAAQFFDPRVFLQERSEGREAYWRLDRPPYSGSIELLARPADTRVIGWQARQYGASAVLLGPANDWGEPGEGLPIPDGERQSLMYPGRSYGLSQPVPSMRLKRLHRSAQDLAYLELLDSQGLGHIGSALSDSLCHRAGAEAYQAHFADGRQAGWLQDLEVWATARQIFADEILRNIRGERSADLIPIMQGPGEPADEMTENILWRRFMQRTRRIDVKVDGVRVVASRSDENALAVSAAVTLTNHTRLPVAGVLRFDGLPLNWETDPAGSSFGDIQPGQSRRITLTASTTAVHTDLAGVEYLPMVLEADDGLEVRAMARLSLITPVRTDREIRIDGNLRDWPTASANTADDFVLITGEAPGEVRLPFSRPAYATQCFAAVDSEALYFAIVSALPAKERPETSRLNMVQYDDGIPVGDELVELLLDPTNAGTRSTADLYHVAVKFGTWMCEKGIRTDPPTGERSVWPADIETGVRAEGDRWVAEVRIPLEAFAGVGERQRVWGVNMTRFNASRQEFSNWAGAVGNAYDPLSLGNIIIP
jgi:hypothetical protein